MAARHQGAPAHANCPPKPPKFKFSTDVNPDTYLLADHLRASFQEAMDADVGVALDLESRAALAWYRVAERAKELRA